MNRLEQNRQELNFLERSAQGVAEKLGQVFSPDGMAPIKVIVTTNPEWGARKEQLVNQAIKFPLITMTLRSFSDSNDFKWNSQTLYNGFYLKDTENPNITNQFKLSYQKVVATVELETEDINELISLIKRWKFRERKAQFLIEGHGFSFQVKLLMPDGFTIPDQAMTDKGNTFKVSSTVNFYTYIGEMITIPAITTTNLQVNLNTGNNDKSIPVGTITKRRKQPLKKTGG